MTNNKNNLPEFPTKFEFNNKQLAELSQLSLADFDFELPTKLIAQHPSSNRSASRLLDGTNSVPQQHYFNQLPNLLTAGDLLIFNNTKVVKARLLGKKSSGGHIEILVERVLNNSNTVLAHFKANRKPAIGSILQLDGGFSAELIQRWPNENGNMFIFRLNANAYEIMQQIGHVPLPPYITHSDNAEDEQRYQTVFAKHPGAVAAPTAALHFDQPLLEQLTQQQINNVTVTLHVGAGTFQPIKNDDIVQHNMHYERYQIEPNTIEQIKACKQRGNKVIAVGTTTVRALETYALTNQLSGDTNIFITPGFNFKLVDKLITNFHLPKSTLLLLVAAFAGKKKIDNLYQYAIKNQLRFFSYGDAMLLEKI